MKFNNFNEKPVKFQLDNGLNVELIYAPTNQTYVEYDVPLGSFHKHYVFENKPYTLKSGIAHFLEHMIYMMDDHDAFEHFHKLGVIANAMTTYRQTTYGVIGHKNMLEATLYLIDMLETPVFTTDRIQAEKSIIGEEISMYDDELDTTIQKKMFDQLIFNHPMKSEITGTKSDIAKIKQADLKQAFNHFYASNQRQLLILGPIDVNLYKDALLNYQSKLQSKLHPTILSNDELPFIKINEASYDINLSVGIFNLGIKYQLIDYTEKELYKLELITLFLMRMLYGSSSNFHQKLINLNLIVDEFNFNVILEDHTMVFMMDSETNQSYELKEMVLNQFFKTKNEDLTESAFKTLKKAYLGHFMMALDDIENRLFLYGKYQLNGMSLDEAFTILDNLTFEDIIDFKSKLDIDMFSFSHFVSKAQKN